MSGYRPRHAASDTPPAGTPAAPGPPAGPPAGERGTEAASVQAHRRGSGELPAEHHEQSRRRGSGELPAEGHERPRRRGSGTLALAAAAVAVLAVVAVLLIASLPKSNHPVATRGGGRRSTPSASVASSGRTPVSPRTPNRKVSQATSPTQASRSKRAQAAPRTGPATKAAGNTTPPTSPAVATSPAENLPVPAGFGPLLREVWVSAAPGHAGITAADVLSTLPGSVYYAEQPAIAYYWAVSQFVPSASATALGSTPAGRAVLAQFASVAVFYKAPGRGWTYAGAYKPGTCSAVVPAPVYKVWGFCLSSQVGS